MLFLILRGCFCRLSSVNLLFEQEVGGATEGRLIQSTGPLTVGWVPLVRYKMHNCRVDDLREYSMAKYEINKDNSEL